MADVYFIGELQYAVVECSTVSVTWAIVPGNVAWAVRGGNHSGETHTSLSDVDGRAILNHPIDIQYETSSSEGWPFFVCEIWDKSSAPQRNFLGCGCVWLPCSAGDHILDIHLWKPLVSGDSFAEIWLPSCPDLKRLRELIVRPYLRSAIETTSIGMLRLGIHCVHSGLEQSGVQTSDITICASSN